ncbi:MAG: universal stress protein [Acidimicrobiia bacterium]
MAMGRRVPHRARTTTRDSTARLNTGRPTIRSTPARGRSHARTRRETRPTLVGRTASPPTRRSPPDHEPPPPPRRPNPRSQNQIGGSRLRTPSRPRRKVIECLERSLGSLCLGSGFRSASCWRPGWVAAAIRPSHGWSWAACSARCRFRSPCGRSETSRRCPTGPSVSDRPVGAGTHGKGSLRVLVGVDGSDEARTALRTAIRLLGPRLGALTLASVIDYDTAMSDEPWPERDRALAELEWCAQLAGDKECPSAGTVLLAGVPSEALVRHAREHGHDLLVIGTRGRGASKLVLGSVASRVARHVDVPVLLVSGPASVTPNAGV